MELNGFRAGRRETEIYFLFTLNPLHIVHFDTSNVLRECGVLYRSKSSMLPSGPKRRAAQKPMVWIRNLALRKCNVLLFAFQGECGLPVLEVDVSKADALSERNGRKIDARA